MSSQAEMVNHPSHYNQHPSGVEVIEVSRWMSFDLGNAFKYVARGGLKGGTNRVAAAIEDFKKAMWYVQDALDNRDTAMGTWPKADTDMSRIEKFISQEVMPWKRQVFSELWKASVSFRAELLESVLKKLQESIHALERENF